MDIPSLHLRILYLFLQMRLIAGNLRALRHLKFDECQFQGLDANALDPFPEFGARLHSLSFSMVCWIGIEKAIIKSIKTKRRHDKIKGDTHTHNLEIGQNGRKNISDTCVYLDSS